MKFKICVDLQKRLQKMFGFKDDYDINYVIEQSFFDLEERFKLEKQKNLI